MNLYKVRINGSKKYFAAKDLGHLHKQIKKHYTGDMVVVGKVKQIFEPFHS